MRNLWQEAGMRAIRQDAYPVRKKHFYNYNQCILKNIIKKLFAKLLTFSRNDAYFSQLKQSTYKINFCIYYCHLTQR